MNHRLNIAFGKQRLAEGLVAQFAGDELCLRRNCPRKPCRQPVCNQHFFASVHQLPDHVAADVASAACHQDRHLPFPANNWLVLPE